MEVPRDRKSTRLNSSHTEIYTLSLHDALPISRDRNTPHCRSWRPAAVAPGPRQSCRKASPRHGGPARSEEHTSELQSHRDLHSFPTRRSSDLARPEYSSLPVMAPSRSSTWAATELPEGVAPSWRSR